MKTIRDLFAGAPAPHYKGVTATSHYIPMPDGVQIAVDVMLPAGLPVTTRIPALLILARYWRSLELRIPNPPNKALIGPREPIGDDLIPRGFGLVVADVRGTGASTGISLCPWSAQEVADYAHIARWVQSQTWCSGALGAFGISYEGASALRLAAVGVEGVKAIVPQEIEYDVYTDVALPGGLFNQAFINEWNASNQLLDNGKPSKLFPFSARLLTRGVRPVAGNRERLMQAIRDHQANTNVYQAIQNVTYRDDLFGSTGVTLDDFSVFPHQQAIEAGGAALFSWGSWLDGASASAALRTFNSYRNPQIAVIGAWKHEMTAHGSPYQRPQIAPSPAHGEQWAALAQFFAQTLVDDQPPQGKTLFYYTLGEEVWKQTAVWPLPGVKSQTWYFQPDNSLAPEQPAAAAHRYTVDFEATTGLTNRWHTQMAKPLVYPDRARADGRLLTYTSAPLTADLELAGSPVIRLQVASSEPDGAFFAYLEAVDAKGVVRYLTEGQLRGIHRRLSNLPAPYWTDVPQHSFRRADSAPLPRGETVELCFGLQPLSALLRRGERLRVALAGADKDTFARVPAQGTPAWTVQCGVQGSRIELPVLPR